VKRLIALAFADFSDSRIGDMSPATQISAQARS
jgi:hypothetical protein